MHNAEKLQNAKGDFTDFTVITRNRTSELPNPENTIRRLSICVLEILSGVRDLDQIISWTTNPVYNHLQRRVMIAQRARAIKKQPIVHNHYTVASMRWNEICDGAIEASVIVKATHRARAISLRLEGLGGMWKATAFHVL